MSLSKEEMIIAIEQEILPEIQKLVNEDYRTDGYVKTDPPTITVQFGKTYAKLIFNSYDSRSSFGFICLQDTKRFKQGDILKAASWTQPATNKRR